MAGQPLLGEVPADMPDPNVAPPQVARKGDPFSSLRIVVGLARLTRNATHQLRDVVAALDAAYLDWSFTEEVVLAELVQLQSNWSISFTAHPGSPATRAIPSPTSAMRPTCCVSSAGS